MTASAGCHRVRRSSRAEPGARITGEYVEARTAEVFAGGCIMNSEAETMGRQADHGVAITSGSFDGVALDGLTVAAAVAGDRNLGMREMGGEEPTAVKAIITVDPRATAAQRDALVRLVRELSGGLITHVVRVDTAPVRFATSQNYVEVSVPDSVHAHRQQGDEARPELRRDAVVQAVHEARALRDGRCRSSRVFGAGPRHQVVAPRTSAPPSLAPSLTERDRSSLFLVARSRTERHASHRKAAGGTSRRRCSPALQPPARRSSSAMPRSRSGWCRQSRRTADGPGWSSVESGTLVGAMRVSGRFKEIRGKVVKPGVYTLRYGQQPQNGDHLGISPFREFLLISPAALDTDPKVLGFDGVVALSKQVIGTSHPASLSLDPPEDAPGAVLSTYKNESGHDGVVFAGRSRCKFGSDSSV